MITQHKILLFIYFHLFYLALFFSFCIFFSFHWRFVSAPPDCPHLCMLISTASERLLSNSRGKDHTLHCCVSCVTCYCHSCGQRAPAVLCKLAGECAALSFMLAALLFEFLWPLCPLVLFVSLQPQHKNHIVAGSSVKRQSFQGPWGVWGWWYASIHELSKQLSV